MIPPPPRSTLFPYTTPFRSTVNAVPAVPAAPTASVTVQPTCAIPTATIVITAPVGAGFEYSLDGGTFQLSPTFAGVSPGTTHDVTARNTADNTCVSAATTLTVNAVPAGPAAQTSRVTSQTTCAIPTATIMITAPVGPAFGHSLDGVTFQLSPT